MLAKDARRRNGTARMPGLGTIINVAAIVVAGLLGAVAGKLLNERLQDGLAKTAGVCVLFIGAAGALQGMLAVEGGSLIAGQSLFVVISIVIGTLIGMPTGRNQCPRTAYSMSLRYASAAAQSSAISRSR